jgi:hypothetical protein
MGLTKINKNGGKIMKKRNVFKRAAAYILVLAMLFTLASVQMVSAGTEEDAEASEALESPFARVFPDATNKTMIFVDQLPTINSLTPEQVEFIATHYVGAQKLTVPTTDAIRAINPDFIMLHYHLAIWQSYVDYIVDGYNWANDIEDVWEFDEWFMHRFDPDTGEVFPGEDNRVYAFDDHKYLMNIMNEDYYQFFKDKMIRQCRAGKYDGIFLDSYHTAVLNYYLQQYPEYSGTTASFSTYPELGDNMSWQQASEIFMRRLTDDLNDEGIYTLPNLGNFCTAWDKTDYTISNGGMTESAFNYGSLYDWKLGMNGHLKLVANDKIDICQEYLPDQWSYERRLYYLGNYLLLRGKYTYLNYFHDSTFRYYPEYDLDLGAPITFAGDNIDNLEQNGLYVREFEKGTVIVCPRGAEPASYEIPNDAIYKKVKVSGTGVVDEDGNYDGSLSYEPVEGTITLNPWQAVILVKEAAALTAPELVSAEGLNTHARLTWNSVDGAEKYIIRYGTEPGNYTQTREVGGNVTKTEIAGLTNGTEYYFAVSAAANQLESVPSNEISAVPALKSEGPLYGWADWELRSDIVHGTIWVSNDGDNIFNDGSEENPLRTIGYALQQARPGDTIIVKPGVYYEYQVGSMAGGSDLCGGTDDAWITVKSEVKHGAVIDGLGVGEVVRFYERHHFIVDGFEVRNSGNNLIHADGKSHHLIFRNIYAHHAGSQGAGGDVMKFNQSSDITVEYCELAYPGSRDDTAWQEIIDYVDVDNAVVRNNYLYGAGGIAMKAKGGSRNALFENNIVVGPQQAMYPDALIGIGAWTGSNLFVDGDVYESYDMIVRNNIVIGAKREAIGVYDSIGARIYNNTIIDAGLSGIFFRDGNAPMDESRDVEIFNNIFLNTKGEMYTPITKQAAREVHDVRHGNNLFWNNGNPIPTGEFWGFLPVVDILEEEANNVVGDPRLFDLDIDDITANPENYSFDQLAEKFHPTAGSAAIGIGIDNEYAPFDFFGNERSETPDAGAISYYRSETETVVLHELINTFIESGDMETPIIAQLTNRLRQVEHHLAAQRLDVAIHHMEKFLEHLNNESMSKFISEEAKNEINVYGTELLEHLIWLDK